MTLDDVINEKPNNNQNGTTNDIKSENTLQLLPTSVGNNNLLQPNTDKDEESNFDLIEYDYNSISIIDDSSKNCDTGADCSSISTHEYPNESVELDEVTTVATTSTGESPQNNNNSKLQSQLSRQSTRSKVQSFRLTHRTSFLSPSNNGVINNLRMGNDFPDSTPENLSFTYRDAGMMFVSIGSYLVDIISDITVATLHYLNGNYWYFALTLCFVAIPALIMTSISLRWYILDSREKSSPKVSKFQWLLRVFFLVLQLGPIMRYIDSLLYGLKFRKHNGLSERKAARKYFHYMIYEDTDATMLRLFESFMEAAPQLVLQIYILANSKSYHDKHWAVLIQIVCVITSLVSLSWSLVSHQRILRMSLPEKQNMTWPGTIVQFIWRFLMIASRVLALALFASAFTYYISIVCGVHWLVMLLWIVSMNTNFCDNCLEELCYNAVLATMFIFCYFNPVDSPTRWRYTLYYSFMLMENSILMILWYLQCDSSKWYQFAALISYYSSFLTGLVFMVIYYLYLHPTGNIHIFSSSNQLPSDDIRCQTTTTTNKSTNELYNCPNSAGFSIVTTHHNPDNPQQQQQQQKYLSPNNNQRNSSQYRRQFSDIWTTQGRLLHPRPAMPTM